MLARCGTGRPATKPPTLHKIVAVQRRGNEELRQLARDMHERQRPPGEILAALLERVRLLAAATGFRPRGCLSIVRELPGHEKYDPVSDAEAVEKQWRADHLAIGRRFTERAGSIEAERVRRVIENYLKEQQYGK